MSNRLKRTFIMWSNLNWAYVYHPPQLYIIPPWNHTSMEMWHGVFRAKNIYSVIIFVPESEISTINMKPKSCYYDPCDTCVYRCFNDVFLLYAFIKLKFLAGRLYRLFFIPSFLIFNFFFHIHSYTVKFTLFIFGPKQKTAAAWL
jgi:hypothetical protein